MTSLLFLRDGEDPETYASLVRLWGVIHGAELAFEEIVSGYGVNHTSKWARDVALAAIYALAASAVAPSAGDTSDAIIEGPGNPNETPDPPQ